MDFVLGRGIDFDFFGSEGGDDGIGSAKKSNIGAEKSDAEEISVFRFDSRLIFGFITFGFLSSGKTSPACFLSKAVKTSGRLARTRKLRFRMNAGTRRTSGSLGSAIYTYYNAFVFDLNKKEERIFRRLNTPAKIQDFLNRLQPHKRDTCFSPRTVLKKGKAHCMEGAMFAAAALRFHGFPPLIVDLTASKKDFDHVIAVFQIEKKWGAISKTNHAVLRYREPVYVSIRELAMSYFHEYFTDDGKKTLRSYSDPVNLSRFDKNGWMTSEEEVWYIPEYLAEIPHHKILTRSQISRLRHADPIEIKVGKMLEWK